MERTLRLLDGRVPALVVAQGRLEDARRGTILFHHGFTAAKETHRPELETLAAAGFLAVGIDALGHGERRYADFDARFEGSGPPFHNALLDVVEATAAETTPILDELIERGWARPGAIGLAGISMGALVTYWTLVAERRIEAAVALLGSTRLAVERPSSPCLHADRFFPVALLSQTAGADIHVPPGPAREFHRTLEPLYAGGPERLCYVEHAGAGHFVPEPAWLDMRSRMVEWFSRFLVADPPARKRRASRSHGR